MAQTQLAQLRPKVNQRLRQACQAKHFIIASDIPCIPEEDTTNRVDLVVLIDTSDSMKDEATELSTAAKEAVESLAPNCDYDLRALWFGIEGTWPDTQFSQSYRHYLHRLGVADADIRGRRRDTVINQGAQEDGARAIIDIVHHFDWRSGALRLILYLGDEALEGGNPKTAEDVQAANEAITTARDRAVKVFAYAGTGRDKVRPDPNTVSEYKRLAAATGGQAYAAPLANLYRLGPDLADLICAGDGDDEGDVQPSDIRPCFELRWGDGPQDHLETDDREILCLAASNPYANVTLKNVTIMLIVVADTAGNPVTDLPDGYPSVLIKPSNVIYFGDLPPYTPKTPAASTAVSREVVLISRGARPGDYLLKINYCHEVEFMDLQGRDTFKLELTAS